MPRRTIWSVLAAALLCLVMLPVTALAAGEHDSHSNGWTEFTAGTTTLSGGSYYLSRDVEYTGTESITVSGEVILCLNGQELDLKGQHISVGSGASLTLCDCSTGGVLTGGSGSHGGGVYVAGGGTFTLTGGNITGNTAAAGGGVYVDKDGTFTMAGGSINNNKAILGGGGGVIVREGTFTLSGGSITGNATDSAKNGYGGGVCLYGTFYLSGDPIIQDNTKDNTADNLYLGWQTINIAGPLGESAHIGVNAENVPRSFISGWSDNMAGENPADYFSSDGDAWGIGLNAAGDVVLGNLCTIITQPADKSVIEGETATFTVNATGNEPLSYQWQQNMNGSGWTDITGEINATYTTGKTTMDMNGTQYRCVVSNSAGSVISDPATLTVAHVHNPATAWSSDESGHWHSCENGCGTRLDAAAHEPETTGEKDATCTKEGYTGDTVCSVCGYVIAKGATIPATDHTWGAWGVTEPATCTEDGLETRACAACGETENQTVPASGHSFTSYVPNDDATCTEDGTETAACDNGCGATDTRTDEGSALGHAWGEPAWSWSDDGSSATATFTCENDSKHVQKPEVTVSSEVLLAPTCTEAGTTRYTATVELGGQTYTSTKDVADIPATDHGFTSYVSNGDATCTEDGTETAACDNGCGATDTRTDEGSALGHELERVDEITATCTEPGTREHWECARCGALFADEDGKKPANAEELAIPATGHSPATTWSSDESGHWHSCENGCGTRLDAAAHEPETTGEKDATCTDEGYTGDMTCATCGYVIAKGEKVPATGHSWDAWDVTEPATCTEDGLETRACEACGEEESRSVPALGHDWGEPEWSWSEDGTSFVATFACAHDASHVTELMAKPASEVVSEPTCTEPGVTRYYAEVELDGVTYAAESTAANVPALGHDFENGTCTVCGAKEEGYVAPEEPKDPEQTPEPSDPEPTVPETGDATASFSVALGVLGAAALGVGALARRRG